MNRALLILVALAVSACATTGATYRSGVGESYLEHPPYYGGRSVAEASGDSARVGHFPIAFQRGATQPAMFDPRDGSGSAIDSLLSEMNAYLDSLGATKRLVEGRRVSAVAHQATQVPPDVMFGCPTEGNLPGSDCIERGDAAVGGRGYQALRLAVGRPSREWTEWSREVLTQQDASHALLITLEIGQYWPRQRGLRGTKEVEIGTNNVVGLPWLTSLEKPVMVLQLTGVVVDRDGKAVGMGAEGLSVKRTPLVLSAFGVQEVIDDSDIRSVRANCDWRTAMSTLVRTLLR